MSMLKGNNSSCKLSFQNSEWRINSRSLNDLRTLLEDWRANILF